MSTALPGRGPATRSTMRLLGALDTSSSMAGSKIQSVDRTMHEVCTELQEIEASNPSESELKVGINVFSDTARWQIPPATRAAGISWPTPLVADGRTAMGASFRLFAEQLSIEQMGPRNKPPLLFVASDGKPNDDWQAGLAALDASDWGKRPRHHVRLAIAVGADCDRGPLEAFIRGAREHHLVEVTNRVHLREVLLWATVRLSQQLSQQKSEPLADGPRLLPPPTADDPDEF